MAQSPDVRSFQHKAMSKVASDGKVEHVGVGGLELVVETKRKISGVGRWHYRVGAAGRLAIVRDAGWRRTSSSGKAVVHRWDCGQISKASGAIHTHRAGCIAVGTAQAES